MRIKRQLLVPVIVLASAACCAGGEAATSSLGITLAVPKAEFVQGEPIVATQLWSNTGTEAIDIPFALMRESPIIRMVVEGPARAECSERPVHITWAHLAHVSIPPGSTVEARIEMAVFGVVSPGHYGFRVEFDASRVPDEWRILKIPAPARSNTVRFSVVPANGVDSIALERFGTRCGTVITNYIEGTEPLLREFPTSTYARWVATYRLWGSDPQSWRKKKADVLLRADSEPYPGAEDLLRVIKSCKEDPRGFPYMDDLRFGEVFLLWHGGRRAEAIALLEQLAARNAETGTLARSWLERARSLVGAETPKDATSSQR